MHFMMDGAIKVAMGKLCDYMIYIMSSYFTFPRCCYVVFLPLMQNHSHTQDFSPKMRAEQPGSCYVEHKIGARSI